MLNLRKRAHDMEKNTLSSSLEDYIEAVFMLADKRGETRIIDVSNKLGYSKPSVNAAMKTLAQLGLIEHEPYGKIILTDKGRAKGEEVLARHKLLKDFFMSVLGLSEKQAEVDACKAEHTLSTETLEGLRLLNYVLKEPANRSLLERIKGKPESRQRKETPLEEKTEIRTKTLKDAKVGETVRVVRVQGRGPVRRRIMDMGITKGVDIFVRKVAPLGDPMELNLRGYELTLRKADAEMIVVVDLI